MVELNLQDEVDRKAFASIEQLIAVVESGLLTGEQGIVALNLLMTAVSGVVKDDALLVLAVDEATEWLKNQPRTQSRYSRHYKSDKTSVVVHFDRERGVCILPQHGEGTDWMTFDTDTEMHQYLMKVHKKLLNKGFTL